MLAINSYIIMTICMHGTLYTWPELGEGGSPTERVPYYYDKSSGEASL